MSYEDFGQCISSGAGYIALGWVESHVMNGFLKLFPMSCELLNTGLTFQVP